MSGELSFLDIRENMLKKELDDTNKAFQDLKSQVLAMKIGSKKSHKHKLKL